MKLYCIGHDVFATRQPSPLHPDGGVEPGPIALDHRLEALARQVGDTQGGYVVHVRPELVVEIALDGVQRSTRYPGGVALRFARVRRYRPDKQAAEADTIERVQAMLLERRSRAQTLAADGHR